MPQAIPNTAGRIVLPDANSLPYNNVQAGAAAFGALIGQSVGNLGSSLAGVGQDTAQIVNSINEQNTQRIARNSDTAYAKALQTASMGDGKNIQGLFNMKGQAALDAIQPFMKSMDDTKQQLADNLPNGVAKNLFLASAQERDNMLMPRVLAHVNEQRDVAADRTDADTALQAKNDGANAWNDPNTVNANRQLIEDTALNTAQRHGLDPAAQTAAQKEAVAGYWDKVITGALYSGVPNAAGIAQKMLADNQAEVGGIYHAMLQEKIQSKVNSDIIAGERHESLAHQQLERAQQQNFGQFAAGLAHGTSSLTDIANAMQTSRISGDQGMRLYGFSQSITKSSSNPEAFNRHLLAINQGESTLDDVAGLTDVSEQERTQLIDKQVSFTKEGGNLGRADVKQAQDYLKALTGGARGVFGEMDAESTSRVANALDEFNTAVQKMPSSGITPQFLSDTKQAIASKYAPTGPLSQIETLPTSNYLPISSYTPVKSQMTSSYQAGIKKLNADVSSGKISKQQYLAENGRLNSIKKAIDLMPNQTTTPKTGP